VSKDGTPFPSCVVLHARASKGRGGGNFSLLLLKEGISIPPAFVNTNANEGEIPCESAPTRVLYKGGVVVTA